MSVREHFQAELDDLKQLNVQLGLSAKQALSRSVQAMMEQDIELAEKVIKEDAEINKREAMVQERAIALIAKQQPVATDLRRIIVAMKIASDVERLGDLAVNISKSVKEIGSDPYIKPLVDLPKMAKLVDRMLDQVLDAFQKDSVPLAMSVAQQDDQVDELYGLITRDLFQMMSGQPDKIAQIAQLSFICRHFERAGDHVVNICESIVYLVKGIRCDLD
ncbi:phosphate signaling complex protein PhoU [Pullulanibacillus sp. KACC 23026]|uniref:phosphate signaling complex protein PhoU n=1 Tax=Pullulanibacillus sp. KACC 23026 TaxID=3028315 RepID=UPI0023AF9212|nr:phosphate signaling complex protein PhoU [Pullulanibacillus sp. KACC 23026]WEG14267.1 phosphate signaling complex protein PhoU [Pullulanibacillus sp. KACC 23026]